MGGMASRTDHFTLDSGGVTIAACRGGEGPRLVLCPGLTSTRAELTPLISELRRDFEVTTFDLRGHGSSAAGQRYRFEDFLADFRAVMAELGPPDPSAPPVLVGHSLGADLIVHYVSENPGTAAELVVIDGANPVPEPFATEADIPEFRAMLDSVHAPPAPERQVLPTTQDILDLQCELDVIRAAILDRYRRIHCPITMVMAAHMAGDGDDERTRWRNRNWRAGVDRLVREQPHIATRWLDADHGLVITHAAALARIVRGGRRAISPKPPD